MNNSDMPAMPTGIVSEEVFNDDGEFSGSVDGRYLGLTKREYFAGLAMQGLLANSCGPIQQNAMSGFGWCNTGPVGMAQFALSIADELLAELDK